MKNDLYYNFPENGCSHESYSKSKCEWEKDGKLKSNVIMECDQCHALAETKSKISGE